MRAGFAAINHMFEQMDIRFCRLESVAYGARSQVVNLRADFKEFRAQFRAPAWLAQTIPCSLMARAPLPFAILLSLDSLRLRSLSSQAVPSKRYPFRKRKRLRLTEEMEAREK